VAWANLPKQRDGDISARGVISIFLSIIPRRTAISVWQILPTARSLRTPWLDMKSDVRNAARAIDCWSV